MEEWEIPGASVAIAKDGNLVLARGYGLASVEGRDPVHADSLFRIASISKPITAVAVLQLVEEGKLDLDESVFEILDQFQAPEGAKPDTRLDDITVRHLLQHSGGWDRDESFDPMWSAGKIQRDLGVAPPVSCGDAIRFMLGQPLDFEPGTRFAYSNFGYCLLGRVIEEKTGQSYYEYVEGTVLSPLGITRMKIGGTLLEDRLEGEVKYYGYPGQDLAYSAMPGNPVRVPWPYGGFYVEGSDSYGGWVASAVDLLRFVTAIDGSRPPSPLKPETVAQMLERPDIPQWQGSAHYYGMGWDIRPVQGDANWWHFGGMPGSRSLLVRAHHGLTWAALFNSRPRADSEFIREVDRLMWKGVNRVNQWPSEDLFPSFGHE